MSNKTIKPMTIEELMSLPDSAFPLKLRCFDSRYITLFEEITILSAKLDSAGRINILDKEGAYGALLHSNLHHYPSLKQEPEKVMWYEALVWWKYEYEPRKYAILVKSKEHFLKIVGWKESDCHFINLVPVGEYPDYSEEGK